MIKPWYMYLAMPSWFAKLNSSAVDLMKAFTKWVFKILIFIFLNGENILDRNDTHTFYNTLGTNRPFDKLSANWPLLRTLSDRSIQIY